MPPRRGLAGRDDLGGGLRVYASAEAHSSVEKACMTLGLGRSSLVRIPTNDRFEMLSDGAGRRDRARIGPPAAGRSRSSRPSGRPRRPRSIRSRRSPTSPSREGLWLHVDAAYAGVVAMLPDATRAVRRLGARRLDRGQPAQVAVHAARRLAAADPPDGASCGRPSASCRSTCARWTATSPVRDYNEFTPQLGRRFRALKLWVQLRWFGLEGLRRRIERHLELAADLAAAIDADPDWELLAPVPFSTVCFRWRPAALAGRAGEPEIAERLDVANAAIMDAVNRTGEVFLSHTRLGGRVHDPGRRRQPADRGAPRRAGLGAAAGGRRRADRPGAAVMVALGAEVTGRRASREPYWTEHARTEL